METTGHLSSWLFLNEAVDAGKSGCEGECLLPPRRPARWESRRAAGRQHSTSRWEDPVRRQRLRPAPAPAFGRTVWSVCPRDGGQVTLRNSLPFLGLNVPISNLSLNCHIVLKSDILGSYHWARSRCSETLVGPRLLGGRSAGLWWVGAQGPGKPTAGPPQTLRIPGEMRVGD